MKDELKVLYNAIIDVMQCDISELSPETGLQSDLGVDSLDAYQIMTIVQSELNISVDPDEVEKIKTVGDAYDLIMAVVEDEHT